MTDRYVYDAFGVPLESLGTTVNVYRFLGEQLDPNLGLIYLRARYLNAPLGRFVSRDSFPGLLRDPLSLHRYLYAGADPVNKTDPSGLFLGLADITVSESVVKYVIALELGSIGAYTGYKLTDSKLGGVAGFVVGALAGYFIVSEVALFVFGGGDATVVTVEGGKQAQLALSEVVQVKRAVDLGRAVQAAKEAGTFLGKGGAGLALVHHFQQTQDERPDGEAALYLVSRANTELRQQADPYTAKAYDAVAAALAEVGVKPSEPK